MRKLSFKTAVAAIFVLSCSGTAFAWPLNTTIDGSVSLATDPYEGKPTGFDTTYGFGVGVSLDANRPDRKVKIVGRAELSYYRWSESSGYVSWSLTRVPLFLGIRIYMPLKFYWEIGPEANFDTRKSNYTGPLYGIYSPGSSTERRDTRYGVGLGLGIDFPLGGGLTVGVRAKYHATKTSYGTVGVSVGYRF